MFTQAKMELRELLALTQWLVTYDATLAAKPDIQPTDGSREERRTKQLRQRELAAKYELA